MSIKKKRERKNNSGQLLTTLELKPILTAIQKKEYMHWQIQTTHMEVIGKASIKKNYVQYQAAFFHKFPNQFWHWDQNSIKHCYIKLLSYNKILWAS